MSERKSDKDPYAMRGKKEGRIVFQSAHATCSPPASSLLVTMDSSQRAEQTCKYTYL